MPEVEKKTAVPEGAKKPADRKPKAPKPPKAKSKEVEGGREVTLHGITLMLPDKALGNPRVASNLKLIQRAGQDFQDAGEEGGDDELRAEAMGRVPDTLQRLFGYSGEDRIHAALERENGDEYGLEHLVGFLFEAIEAAHPNT